MAKLVILKNIEHEHHGWVLENVFSITYQLVAVETAAPFVLMGSELISVGYSHGTPSIPIPKATWYRKKKATEAVA